VTALRNRDGPLVAELPNTGTAKLATTFATDPAETLVGLSDELDPFSLQASTQDVNQPGGDADALDDRQRYIMDMADKGRLQDVQLSRASDRNGT
jgi:hypothetical protein